MRSLSLSLDRLDDHLSGLILEGVQFLNLRQMKTHNPLEKHKIRAALDRADKGGRPASLVPSSPPAAFGETAQNTV